MSFSTSRNLFVFDAVKILKIHDFKLVLNVSILDAFMGTIFVNCSISYSLFRSVWKLLLSNSFPLSVWSFLVPLAQALMINVLYALPNAFADLSSIGTTQAYLVNTSIYVRMKGMPSFSQATDWSSVRSSLPLTIFSCIYCFVKLQLLTNRFVITVSTFFSRNSIISSRNYVRPNFIARLNRSCPPTRDSISF